MRQLSDKLLRRLIWLLLVLALFFLGIAFYLPAKAIYRHAPEQVPAVLVRQAVATGNSLSLRGLSAWRQRVLWREREDEKFL